VTNQPLNANDDEFISIYVQENLLEFSTPYPDEFRKVMDKMRRMCPQVPVGKAQCGAHNENSTYIHLIVCFLEYFALIDLFGKELDLEYSR
jgi:hypothetical protein